MRSSLLVVSSFLALTACTQSPVVVDMRGTEYFGRNANHSVAYNTAAPVSSVASTSYGSVQSSYQTASRQEMALAQPTQSTAPLGSSIGVSDLEPAAGKPETKLEMKSESQFGQKIEAKPALSMADAAPVNAWTKKPREFADSNNKPTQKTQYIWPVSSRNVTSAFGNKGGGKVSDGISIAAGEGEPVWAAADGEIVYADSKMQGYGKMVIVKHAGGKTSTYAHLARYAVEKYDRVRQGDIIGYVGSTGSAKTSQLYFSMRDGTKAIDPQKILDRTVAGL